MIFAERALLPDGWAEQVRITVAYGHITKVAKAAAPQPGDVPAIGRLEDVERALIERTLEAAGGNISEAAKRLGVSRNTIYRKLRWNQRAG